MTISQTPISVSERRLAIARTLYQALVDQDPNRAITLCDEAGNVVARHDPLPEHDAQIASYPVRVEPTQKSFGRTCLPVAMTSQKIKAARQRLVMIRFMIDSMRSLHGAYAPTDEPFGTRLETFFVGFCVALGDIEGKPFSVTKIAAYLHMPRTTVMRRLKRLESWDIVYRHSHRYHIRETNLNSLMGMRSYLQIRRMLGKAVEELTVLDALPD
jgi:hypothetical protein